MFSKVVKDVSRKNKPLPVAVDDDEYDELEYSGREGKKDIYRSYRDNFKIVAENAENIYNDKIYCECRFEFKDKLKELGFRWEPLIKKWYLPVEDFNVFIYKKTRVLRFSRSTSAGMYNGYFVIYGIYEGDRELLEEKPKPKASEPKPKAKASEPDFID